MSLPHPVTLTGGTVCRVTSNRAAVTSARRQRSSEPISVFVDTLEQHSASGLNVTVREPSSSPCDAFVFDDVTVSVNHDRIEVYDAPIGDPGSFRKDGRLICLVPFRFVDNVTTGRTKNGISVDLPDLWTFGKAPISSALMPTCVSDVIPDLYDGYPPPTLASGEGSTLIAAFIKSVKFSFEISDDRARAFSVIQSQWQRATFYKGRSSTPDPVSPRPQREAAGASPNQRDIEPPSAAHYRTTTNPLRNISHISVQDALGQVRAMQQKTNSLLDQLKLAQGLPVEESRPAEAQAARQYAMDDAAAELREIQLRRDMRASVLDGMLRKTNPSAAFASRDGSPARTKLFECPHCRRPLKDEEVRRTHPPKCIYRPVRCQGCGVTVKKKFLPNHHERDCPSPPTLLTTSTGSSRPMSTSMRRSERPSSPRPSSPSLSEESEGSIKSPRMRQKERVKRILQQQEEERRRATPTSTVSLSLCPHCGKAAPPTHPPKCSQRKMKCQRCNTSVIAKDAARHSELCKAREADRRGNKA